MIDSGLETSEAVDNDRNYWDQPGISEMDAVLEADWARQAYILDMRARAAMESGTTTAPASASASSSSCAAAAHGESGIAARTVSNEDIAKHLQDVATGRHNKQQEAVM